MKIINLDQTEYKKLAAKSYDLEKRRLRIEVFKTSRRCKLKIIERFVLYLKVEILLAKVQQLDSFLEYLMPKQL